MAERKREVLLSMDVQKILDRGEERDDEDDEM